MDIIFLKNLRQQGILLLLSLFFFLHKTEGKQNWINLGVLKAMRSSVVTFWEKPFPAGDTCSEPQPPLVYIFLHSTSHNADTYTAVCLLIYSGLLECRDSTFYLFIIKIGSTEPDTQPCSLSVKALMKEWQWILLQPSSSTVPYQPPSYKSPACFLHLSCPWLPQITANAVALPYSTSVSSFVYRVELSSWPCSHPSTAVIFLSYNHSHCFLFSLTSLCTT